MALKAAIENSPNKTIIFTATDKSSLSLLKDDLKELFGEGKFNIDDQEVTTGEDAYTEYTVYPSNVKLTDEVKENAGVYELGEQDNGLHQTKKATKEDVEVLKRVLQRYEGEHRLNDEHAEKLAESLYYYLRDAAPTAIKLLNKMDWLRIMDLVDKKHPFNGALYWQRGIMELNGDKISPTSSTLTHELTHAAVAIVTDDKRYSRSGFARKLLFDLIEEAKERALQDELHRLRNSQGIQTETGMGRRREELATTNGDVPDSGIRHTVGILSGPVASKSGHATTLLERGDDLHGSTGSSNSGVLGNESGRSGVQTTGTPDSVRLSDSNTNAVRGALERTNGRHGRKHVSDYGKTWRSAESLVNKTTEKTLNKTVKDITQDINFTISYTKMTMSEKSHIILSNLWAIRQLDKKFKQNNQLVNRILSQLPHEHKDPKVKYSSKSPMQVSNIFDEAIAYAMHTTASPELQGRFFDTALSLDKEIKKASMLYSDSDYDMNTRRANKQRIEQIIYGDGILKSSLASHKALPNDTTLGPYSTDKFKDHVIVTYNDVIDTMSGFHGDADIHSITDRIMETKLGKVAKELNIDKENLLAEAKEALVKEMISAHNARGGLVGKPNSTPSLLAAFASSSPQTQEERKAAIRRNEVGFDNDEAIRKLYVDLFRKYGTPQLRKAIKGKSTKVAETMISGHLDLAGNPRKSPYGVFYHPLNSAIVKSLQYIAETGDKQGFDPIFEKYYKAPMPKEIKQKIVELYNQARLRKHDYSETKFLEKLDAPKVAIIYIDETSKGSRITKDEIERYKRDGAKKRILVISGKYPSSKANKIINTIFKSNLQNRVMYQQGKEDTVNDVEVKQNSSAYPQLNPVPSLAETAAQKVEAWVDKIKNKNNHDKITEIKRQNKSGNIPMYGFKKYFQSTLQLIDKYISSDVANKLRHLAKQHSIERNSRMKKYLGKYKEIINNIPEERREKLQNMLRVIRDQGREFVQTYNIEYKDANGVAKSGFVNLGPNGFLHEFGDEQDAKKLYEKLKSEGKFAYYDFRSDTIIIVMPIMNIWS